MLGFDEKFESQRRLEASPRTSPVKIIRALFPPASFLSRSSFSLPCFRLTSHARLGEFSSAVRPFWFGLLHLQQIRRQEFYPQMSSSFLHHNS